MSVAPVRTPAQAPLQPMQPNPQTACGTLDDGCVYNTMDIHLGGQQPNEQFWAARSEYCNQIQWTTQQAIGTTLATIDVLRYCGDDMNNPDNLNANGGLQTRSRAYGRVIWPRWLVTKSSTYISVSVKYDFWLHKPVGPVVGGKLRISYNPGIRKNWNTVLNSIGSTIDSYQDSLFRENLWEWDVKASDTFSVTLNGNIPTKYITSTIPSTRFSEVADPRECFPAFMTSFGTLEISVLNNYVAGSVFADSVFISIYKSFPSLQAYIVRGHRNDQFLTAI